MITWALGHLVTLADLKRRSAIQLVANRGFADYAPSPLRLVVIFAGYGSRSSHHDRRRQYFSWYIRLLAVHHLEKGHVVIFAGGNGQPYVTTDYPAVQRALEVSTDALLVDKS